MEISNRIKELKKLKEISTESFAAIGGVSLRSQQMYESGKTIPTAEYCAAIAAKFKDVSMDWLLTGEGDTYKKTGFKPVSVMDKNGVVNVVNESEGTMLMWVAGESFSDEDVQILRMIKRLPPNKKKDEITDIEKFLVSFEEDVHYWVNTYGAGTGTGTGTGTGNFRRFDDSIAV
jgi:transcriptional regulator with XRE-family HTH domain